MQRDASVQPGNNIEGKFFSATDTRRLKDMAVLIVVAHTISTPEHVQVVMLLAFLKAVSFVYSTDTYFFPTVFGYVKNSF